MTTHNASRREFLRQAGALSALGTAAAPFALNLATLGAAAAQTSSNDYKALVCLFLFGGNDSYNTVLATDAASWANYNAVRQGSGDAIALRAPGTAPNAAAAPGSPDRLGGVLSLSPLTPQSGRSFALHPQLTSLQAMFNAERRLAVVSNVGPLLTPTDKTQYRSSSHPKPAKLFSHNDQQSTWQAFAPESATRGWGGRMADLLRSSNGNAVFTGVSSSGNAVWLAGEQVLQYQVGTNGAIRLGVDANRRLFGNAAVGAALERIVASSRSGNYFEQAYADTTRRSIEAEQALAAALGGAAGAPYGTPDLASGQADPLLQYDHPITGTRATNQLAQQFQIVARMIGAAGALGMRRQVFFVSLGGFDTHDFQNRNHADLMARLAHGLAYFDTVLGALGMRDRVTTFTASDFGRTFTSNGDGTDHGWGAHHFVMGGAVRGGDVYGNFPAYGTSTGRADFTSPNQIGSNGALLPELSVDQYAATLGRWFGLSDAQLLDVLPNLRNFDVSTRNLGFMSA